MNQRPEARFGVIGNPVGHSLSPLIQTHWIRKAGLSASYEAINLQEKELPAFIRSAYSKGFCGLNVTAPFKAAVIPFLDQASEEVEKIGAANTIYIDDRGHIQGFNTDIGGFRRALLEAMPASGLTGASAVVLGSGGAAAAVLTALKGLDLERIVLCSRNRVTAGQLQKQTGRLVQLSDWPARSQNLDQAALLVNATPAGMRGVSELDLDLAGLKDGALVVDLVYAPFETTFLRAARAKGHRVQNGFPMLVHQAALSFQRWFGKPPAVDLAELKELIAVGQETSGGGS